MKEIKLRLFSIAALILLTIFVFISIPTASFAQQPNEETFEGTIKKVENQNVHVILEKGSLKGKEIVINLKEVPTTTKPQTYKAGDSVVVQKISLPNNTESYYIADYVRRNGLYLLFGIFLLLVIVIAKVRGLLSIVGMVFSFFLIFQFLLPNILYGANPIVITIMAAALLIPLNFFLSHGINKKTVSAIISTIIALIITSVLAEFFIGATKLTGFSSEEASFLQVQTGTIINMRSLLMTGLLIALIGILDDITISQSAIVFQLKKASSKLSFRELYQQAMDVGSDHIASTVNTLILVYTGAALPLLLLFINNPKPFGQIINLEIVAEEIVRTLIGSIGIIIAVPIATVIAVYIASQEKN